MKIFEEIYSVKTLEELGFVEISDDMWGNFIEHGDCFNIFIQRDLQTWAYFTDIDKTIGRDIHRAVELKMIELGLWDER